MRPARIVSALSLVVILASGASATHGGIHPTFKTQTVYFHCTGDTPVYNVNWLQQVGASTAYARWDTSAPAGSVTDGEGCGGADAGWVTNEVYDPVYEGTFTGNLRDMTIRIDDFVLNNDRDPDGRCSSGSMPRSMGNPSSLAARPKGATTAGRSPSPPRERTWVRPTISNSRSPTSAR